MGATRKGIELKRGKKRRAKKNIILLALEGDNKTERLYFGNFRNHDKYVIHIAKGNDTSPMQMIKSLKKDFSRLEINTSDNDIAACIFDSDIDLGKQTEINKCIADAKNQNIEIIISNPCFEIWYLSHFVVSTKYYKNEDVINELKKYIPDYNKAKNVYPEIYMLTNEAIKNAKALENHHKDLNRNLGDMRANPSTNVYKMVEVLTSRF